MKPLRVLASAPSLLIAAFLLAGCASSVPGGDTVPRTSELPGSAKPEGLEQAGTKPDLPKPTREQIAEAQAEGLTPPHMIGRDITRAAVLLPFSHPNRQVRDEAQGMLAGIEMALFELASDDFLIIPKDTAGTVAGAETAAKEAIVAGADVVLGPLFSQNVRSVAPISFTQNAPVIAFSNDPTAAGGGAYLASFTVEEEVARVVEYATFQGIEAFAYLGPDSAYGRRVESALRQHSAANGAYVLATQFYDPSNAAPVDEAQAIANILGPMVEDNPGKVGVMIPESGVKLRSVAPLLPYYGVDFRNLRMLGTSQWDDPSIWREPTLNGAWFAVPDD
ncbi:MAG: penicillin-binding protein activator, partial [Pseudomonadota bacterium]